MSDITIAEIKEALYQARSQGKPDWQESSAILLKKCQTERTIERISRDISAIDNIVWYYSQKRE